jgi:Mg-chelatase subunit ChlI
MKRTTLVGHWGIKSHRIDVDIPRVSSWDVVKSLRAGSTEEEDEGDAYDEEDEDYFDDEDDEVNDEDESSSDEEEEEEEEAESEEVEPQVDEAESTSVAEYDEQLSPPPGLQMGALLCVMLLSRRLDLFHPKVVRFAR